MSKQYLKPLGSIMSDGGIFTLSDISSLDLWTGFSVDPDQNDYWRICDLMEETEDNTPFKYKSIAGGNFLVFYTTIKQFHVFHGNNTIALMELEYEEKEPVFQKELEFEIQEMFVSLELTKSQDEIIVFDSAMDKNDIPSNLTGIFRSVRNEHFDDILREPFNSRELKVSKGFSKGDNYTLEGYVITP